VLNWMKRGMLRKNGFAAKDMKTTGRETLVKSRIAFLLSHLDICGNRRKKDLTTIIRGKIARAYGARTAAFGSPSCSGKKIKTKNPQNAKEWGWFRGRRTHFRTPYVSRRGRPYNFNWQRLSELRKGGGYLFQTGKRQNGWRLRKDGGRQRARIRAPGPHRCGVERKEQRKNVACAEGGFPILAVDHPGKEKGVVYGVLWLWVFGLCVFFGILMCRCVW